MPTEYMIIRPVQRGEYHYHAILKTFPDPDCFGNLLTHNLIDAKTWPTKAEAEQFLQNHPKIAAAHRLYPLAVEAQTEAESDLEDALDGLDLEDQLDLLLSLTE